MQEPRPALENLCCLNAQCKTYGQRGQANLTVRKTYGADRIRYLRCRCCGDDSASGKARRCLIAKSVKPKPSR